MKCIDEPYEIYGDYNSDVTANLMAVFVKCDPEKRKCKTRQEIDDWLKFKYLVVLQNESYVFEAIEDVDKRLTEYSTISQHPIDFNVRSDWPRMVYRTENTFDAVPYGFGTSGRTVETFRILESTQRTLPYVGEQL